MSNKTKENNQTVATTQETTFNDLNKLTLSIQTREEILWYYSRPKTKVSQYNPRFKKAIPFNQRKELAKFLEEIPEEIELELTFDTTGNLLIA